MKILFTGGGTMGPVTPLLAVFEAWKKVDEDVQGIWAGTPHGPEGEVVVKQGMRFYALPVARLPRRPSIEWLLLPFRFAQALLVALFVLLKERPQLIASAGGYTAVPIILMGRLLGRKVWVHQQDVDVILTNKLTAPFAHTLTVAWEKNQRDLGPKAQLIGNPVRPSVLKGDPERARKLFGIRNKKPTVLVFGGGSGATWINACLMEISGDLSKKANVIHLTGIGKQGVLKDFEHYHVREFLREEMADVLQLADVVVCRAGTGTISELAGLAKASIIIPLPHSPQEDNAQMIEGAAVVRHQATTSSEALLNEILSLVNDGGVRMELGKKMHAKLRADVADEFVELLRN
ncbi:MAG: glycosyltransferase [bacterium]|jgi:UDP-N-acetylglucosamine--N-acetylmuramyl-(pentapeptide) pyrophosphoryl-undecaprenol N-acetylglucosamine transferase|nr:glycosyltransferase [bacterium]